MNMYQTNTWVRLRIQQKKLNDRKIIQAIQSTTHCVFGTFKTCYLHCPKVELLKTTPGLVHSRGHGGRCGLAIHLKFESLLGECGFTVGWD